MASQPPIAAQIPTLRSHHGDVVEDPYEWLREKESPQTRAYLEAENQYTEARTAHLAPLREQIFNEIKERTQETDLSVPTRIGKFWYYGRSQEGQQYGLSCRCPVQDAENWSPPRLDPAVPVPGEQVLLDSNELAAGHDFFSLGATSLSPCAERLAFSTDTVGDERFTLRIKDLTTGEILADEIRDVAYGATWDATGEYLFYTTVDDAWRPDKVWRHRVGTPSSDDVQIFHEPDERYWISFGRTRSDRFLVLAVGSKVTSEYRILEADDPLGEFRVVAPRREGVEYGVEHAVIGGRDCLLVLHNDHAENFALAIAPVTCTSSQEWSQFLAYDPDVRLEDVDAFATHVVISQRRDGLTGVRVILLDNDAEQGLGEDFELTFEDAVYTVGAGANPEFEQPTLRLGYTTMATPSSVYDFDVRDRSLTLLKQTPVLGGFDPAHYRQLREWAQAPDGTKIPLSIVVPRDAVLDGQTPFLLYGYGSYESSIDPYFTISRLSLLDRGMGFAIAHVRGGGELGRQWYEQGKLLHKRNTFTDFVACADRLIEAGYTQADRLAAEGGSAGGLLMGAVANLAPEKFRAIVADVPFVDALNTILRPELPLTVIEWEEWGNPLADPEVYAYMKSYSPYENVQAVNYPAMLVETSLNDTRVLYVEPAKWVARLRATALNPQDFLLKTEMSAGHGGVSGRYNAWRDRAFSYAWLLDQVGLRES